MSEVCIAALAATRRRRRQATIGPSAGGPYRPEQSCSKNAEGARAMRRRGSRRPIFRRPRMPNGATVADHEPVNRSNHTWVRA